jgi:hypothetical protein
MRLIVRVIGPESLRPMRWNFQCTFREFLAETLIQQVSINLIRPFKDVSFLCSSSFIDQGGGKRRAGTDRSAWNLGRFSTASILSAPIWAEVGSSAGLYAAVAASRKSAWACFALLGDGLDRD